eukprot:CAMPEP_0206226078 /NCGR_PEP_ID=MMETSP0047_2-20121206/7881_1 /ASSEMBLY_ACC=CAM_ASM_000192 /TAXON_ID=195065 /ORGANISM="Chroomonas mesostigmatica_cf, Strain CCMP1168" /LENGTH=55 /DNA_ID=CAMNT_0053649105 /DNA_START=489 /DNA_END=653 /DNA_ORIENTATION=-
MHDFPADASPMMITLKSRCHSPPIAAQQQRPALNPAPSRTSQPPTLLAPISGVLA